MDIHVARQAVLNVKKQTVAYELLFREGSENAYPKDVDSKTATSRLILNHHLNTGLDEITGGKRALINFCGKGMMEGLPKLLPPTNVIIEILESATPTSELLSTCTELSKNGYRLALDDFKYHKEWDPFFKHIRLVKFDLTVMTCDEIERQLTTLKKVKHLKFLAEKVETEDDFEKCKALGFEFFQGYFFCKPEMMSHKDVASNYSLVLAVLTEIHKPHFSFDNLSPLFEMDLAMTYKLLKFINSGLFQLQEKVGSIKQALIYLGEGEARKFISLIAMAHIAQDKPPELVRMSIIRAKMAESIASHTKDASPDAGFLLGLFSLIDAILSKPMDDIALTLPVIDEIKEALLGYKNRLFQILQLIKAHESGSWYNTQRFANVVQIDENLMPGIYSNAVNWSNSYEQATERNKDK